MLQSHVSEANFANRHDGGSNDVLLSRRTDTDDRVNWLWLNESVE
jgi:hypothetical protein